MKKPQRPLPWLDAGEDFPPVSRAWGHDDPAPGLLAAGAALDVPTLVAAYSQGIFPWFSEGQPTLWWSPDPRMVLQAQDFKLHRSLRKTLQHFSRNPACEVRFDTAFADVINACASKPRDGQPGTWILPQMIDAYCALHKAGHAHSVETWVGGELVGGLYCVNLGGMVFGESMFADVTDASKIALCALVAFCRAHGIAMIDCQQNTGHLASLGAEEISRDAFTAHVAQAIAKPVPTWQFDPVYWQHLTPLKTTPTP
jgi:leucyl/phenylalanyl-tRNA---protein transferase